VSGTGALTAGNNASVIAPLGVALASLGVGGTTLLRATGGAVSVGNLTSGGLVTALGRSIDLHSSGGLTFAAADATGGDLFIETAGVLATPDVTATGSLTLQTASGDITTGDLTAGTWLYVDAAGSAALGNLTAALDAAATARGGNLALGDVSAGDEIWLSVFGTDPASTLSAGNLVSSGIGDDTAAGPPVLFGGYPGGAGRPAT
jgi:hypothetical protein